MTESKLRELLDLWTHMTQDRQIIILHNNKEYNLGDIFESYSGDKIYFTTAPKEIVP